MSDVGLDTLFQDRETLALHEQVQAQARCRGMTSIMYIEDERQREKVQRARDVCLGTGEHDGYGPCPVIKECKQLAITLGETNGVWGGVSMRRHSEVTSRTQETAVRTIRRRS